LLFCCYPFSSLVYWFFSIDWFVALQCSACHFSPRALAPEKKRKKGMQIEQKTTSSHFHPPNLTQLLVLRQKGRASYLRGLEPRGHASPTPSSQHAPRHQSMMASHLSCPRLHCQQHAMALDTCSYDCCVLPPLDCLDWGWGWGCDSELLHTHHYTLGGAAAGAGGAAVQAEPTFFPATATRKCSALS